MPRLKETLILVGQVPPPFHGQAVATGVVFDHQWQYDKVIRLPMRYSRTNDEVGEAGFRKIWVLLKLILSTWRAAILNPGAILYYPPAGPNRTPLLRDIIYLHAVRPFVSGCIFHYHAGGLVTYLKSAPAWLRTAARSAYRNAQVSIEISDSDDSPAAYFGANCRKLVRNGLPVPRPPFPQKKENPKVILFVGSLRESKGVLNIIETAKLLQSENGNLVFKIIGKWIDNDFEKQARELVDAYGLTEMVEFPGIITGDEKWRRYQSASLFFFPTHYESENFPLVLIEAMGSGLPVVTTRWRGIPEFVGNTPAAAVCAINSPDEYAAAISQLLSSPATLEDLSQKARLHYEENYTLERFVSSMGHSFDTAFNPSSVS